MRALILITRAHTTEKDGWRDWAFEYNLGYSSFYSYSRLKSIWLVESQVHIRCLCVNVKLAHYDYADSSLNRSINNVNR